MQLPSSKKCLRCNKDFTCNPANVTACQCSGITFTAAEKQFITKQKYSDCLCINCLRALRELASNQT